MKGSRGNLIDLPKNIKAYIQVRSRQENYLRIRYFDGVPNWGDHINPYLIKKITGKTILQSTFGMTEHLLAVGSILRSANSNSIVWGSGFISKKSKFRSVPKLISAVRGPLTGARLEELGVNDPGVYGDPALLMPRFYMPKKVKKYRVGLVAHYAEKKDYSVHYLSSLGVKLIDIQLPVEEFLDKLCQCETIISSSLHGLIAADSYGIPSRWLTLSNKLVGGEFKFQDYYSAIGSVNQNPLLLPEIMSINSLAELEESASKKKINLDLSKLEAAFPI